MAGNNNFRARATSLALAFNSNQYRTPAAVSPSASFHTNECIWVYQFTTMDRSSGKTQVISCTIKARPLQREPARPARNNPNRGLARKSFTRSRPAIQPSFVLSPLLLPSTFPIPSYASNVTSNKTVQLYLPPYGANVHASSNVMSHNSQPTSTRFLEKEITKARTTPDYYSKPIWRRQPHYTSNG